MPPSASRGTIYASTRWFARATRGAEIIQEAEGWPADLIIVGSHGHRGLKRLLLGSVANYVVNHAPCSVEIARVRSTRAA